MASFYVCSISLGFDDQLLNLGWLQQVGNVTAQLEILYKHYVLLLMSSVKCEFAIFDFFCLMIHPKSYFSLTRDFWNFMTLIYYWSLGITDIQVELPAINSRRANHTGHGIASEYASSLFQGLHSCSYISSFGNVSVQLIKGYNGRVTSLKT